MHLFVSAETSCSFFPTICILQRNRRQIREYYFLCFQQLSSLDETKKTNCMRGISGQQWLLAVAVTPADTTVGAACANPEGATSWLSSSSLAFQGIHNKPTIHLLLFSAPHHRPSVFDWLFFFPHYIILGCSTLGQVSSARLVRDPVWTLSGVGDKNLSQYFRRAR